MQVHVITYYINLQQFNKWKLLVYILMNFNVLDNNLKSGRYIILDHVLKCGWVVITLSK